MSSIKETRSAILSVMTLGQNFIYTTGWLYCMLYLLGDALSVKNKHFLSFFAT